MHFNDTVTPLRLLQTRRSAKARDLEAPGPPDDQLQIILQAAMRVPDHGKLIPWRFIVIPSERRLAFAECIEQAYRAEKPSAGRLEVDAMRAYATHAPTLVVVLSCAHDNGRIPVWEQQLSAGAACQTLMLAAHAMGYACNWLTDWPAYSSEVLQALGGSETDRIAGFIYIGTSTKLLEERPRPDFRTVVSQW